MYLLCTVRAYTCTVTCKYIIVNSQLPFTTVFLVFFDKEAHEPLGAFTKCLSRLAADSEISNQVTTQLPGIGLMQELLGKIYRRGL